MAQHSLLVSSLVPAQHQLAALLHDATEAYIGDMTRPLKALMPDFCVIEVSIWRAICDRFNLEWSLPESVLRADMIALVTERRDLMPHHPGEWECLRGIPAMPEHIIPLPAEEASMQFFSRLMELMQGDHRRRVCA
ncbi:phosphohydrolase [Pseudomonas sp. TH03]|uniref:phosphohydrolase n=1 Tax=Pseudomonas sp. TH03 TaxID=2796369 RepID=UPI001911D2A5|nr:phosphohydrolase [Pseudomonas sp. TH03]MBK5549642.1 phosphohydrolase [Pseudomonas sp. TH03]